MEQQIAAAFQGAGRPLAPGDFRTERAYLADQVFALVPGGDDPPMDVVPREAWEGIMDLPTDVLLRTTNHLGLMVDDMHDQGAAWVHATPRRAGGVHVHVRSGLRRQR